MSPSKEVYGWNNKPDSYNLRKHQPFFAAQELELWQYLCLTLKKQSQEGTNSQKSQGGRDNISSTNWDK